MDSPIANPTPKSRFLDVKANIERHRALIMREEFIRAADFALLEYQKDLALQPLNEASASHCKLVGALEFMQVFRNLAETPQKASVSVLRDNLDHKA